MGRIPMTLYETLQTPIAQADNRALLRFYCYYRLLIASMFCLIFWMDGVRLLNTEPNSVMNAVIGLSFLTAVFAIIALWLKWLSKWRYIVLGLFIFDFTSLALMMEASGGATGGLSYLLLVTMAIASLLTQLHTSLALAAYTTILVMSFTVFSTLKTNQIQHDTVFSAGVLGLLLFATSITFKWLAVRIQLSQQAALEQAKQAASLQKLAQQIVKKMRTGLIVLNTKNEVMLANESARQLIGYENFDDTLLKQLKPALNDWLNNHRSPHSIHIDSETGSLLKISFSSLDDRLILFVEDTKQVIQQAQQLKLASLGRLTASIAHEIRNPLGAISHASQLLVEDGGESGDQRLLTIIHNHTQRIDHIINNILQLSSRQMANPEVINLPEWLTQFSENYSSYKKGTIDLQPEQEIVLAKIDSSHLDQVINNLVDNGLRYGAKNNSNTVVIKAYIDKKTGLPCIQVIDHGPGINEGELDKIFEPFYTTEVTGSGLGLYLCRELCEANQANLTYRRLDGRLSCFELQLSHHQRNI